MEEKRPWGCGKRGFNLSGNQHFEKSRRRKCIASAEEEEGTKE